MKSKASPKVATKKSSLATAKAPAKKGMLKALVATAKKAIKSAVDVKSDVKKTDIKKLAKTSTTQAVSKKTVAASAPVKAVKGQKLATPVAAPAGKVGGKGAGKTVPAAPALKAPPAVKLTAKQIRAAAAEAHRNSLCKEVACELTATTKTFCRLHYIKNWKRIQQKEMILQEKKLNLYIEELISKYPDKYIEAIRQDLNSEKDFAKVIADLEIEEEMDDFIDAENEAIENVIEPVVTRREFEDDDDTF